MKQSAGQPVISNEAGAAFSYSFVGNQVRLIGGVAETGGLADVYLDGIKQMAPVDFHSPLPLARQVLYYPEWPEQRSPHLEAGGSRREQSAFQGTGRDR